MTRSELIAALGKASKPSRELDGYIYMLTLPASRRRPVSWEVTPEGMIWAWTRNPPHAPGTGGWWATPPEYTASIDAALTLVPQRCDMISFHSDPSGSGWELGEFTGGQCIKHGEGVTGGLWAIALCIAAIRASAVEVGE